MTEREKEVLQFIIQFKTTNGYSPSVREIARGINTRSITHVSDMLNHLRDLGYIRFKDKQPRTIAVLKFN